MCTIPRPRLRLGRGIVCYRLASTVNGMTETCAVTVATSSVTVIRVQPGLEGIFGFLKREDVRDGIAGVGDGV